MDSPILLATAILALCVDAHFPYGGYPPPPPFYGGGGNFPQQPPFPPPRPQQPGPVGNNNFRGFSSPSAAAAPDTSVMRGRSHRHPSEIPAYQKYFLHTPSPDTQIRYLLDARGRAEVPPSSIGRFRKYFPGAAPCVCKHPDNPMIKAENKPDVKEESGYYSNSYNASSHYPVEPSPLHGPCPRTPNYVNSVTNKKYLVTSLQDTDCSNMTWFDALDFCQDVGMQAVALDADKSPQENKNILKMATDLNMKSYWTGGLVTQNVKSKQTLTWPSESAITSEDVVPGTGLWSKGGPEGKPQPDNHAYNVEPKAENLEKCVAVLNNWYNDGVGLHDARCLDKHPVICEEAQHQQVYSHGLNINMAGI